VRNKKEKIVVAMSGGVDSSTVAALLADAGHEVIGVTLQLYDYGLAMAKKGACCAGQDIYDAQVAAERIGIPHYVLNYESIFKDAVIDDFVDSYIRGETPIPCVRCNQKVKFNDLFKVAKDLGADALATGHYVQRIINNNKAELHKGADTKKDQSYFLFTTTQEQLDFLRFPLGHLHKDETRLLAQKYGLNVADKPDSQDICFVPNGDYGQVIAKLRPEAWEKGDICDMQGNILGQHDGIVNFTIGQRRGIGIAAAEPLYVIKIDPLQNRVYVGNKQALLGCGVNIKELNWLGDADIISNGRQINCIVKLRSAHQGIAAMLHPLGQGKAKVTLTEPYLGITPGQACVIYDIDRPTRVLGGGWITRE
jgi:tRNA-specific 2-thiouridylase